MDLESIRRTAAWNAGVGAVRGALVAAGAVVLVFAAVQGTRLATGGSGAEPAGAPDDRAELPSPGQPVEVPSVDRRVQALASFLARRYRVAAEPVEELVHAAFAAGRLTQLDPLLILAVIAIESRFNPIAESDYGARGLMQVVPRFHLEKLALHGGSATLLEPHTNVLVGAQILDEYIARAGGIEAGLQLYNGALEDPARTYAQRVLAERARLAQVLRSALPHPERAALAHARS
ncbi:MAG: transglycosylase SLT domain-containing protein [Burkholderiales bacterium]